METGKVIIVGGCGHVGLPLGVKFALAGYKTVLVDINQSSVDTVNSGRFPFLELNGDAQLQEALRAGLIATTDKSQCRNAEFVVFVIGTPVDEHLNPKLSDVFKVFDQYAEFFSPEMLVVMRSTLYPGTMEHLHQRLQQKSQHVQLCFCPERVSQGYALDEIDSLPQIVSAFDDASFEHARTLFASMAPEIIRLSPFEAELTKLMANSWRYLEFAIANQFYMIAESNGADFYKIYQAIRYQYPRASGYKSPGFAAGPCLFKDTMQLASFFDNQFAMGHSAMLVNEGLANFAVDKAVALLTQKTGRTSKRRERSGELWGKRVGLLGMTFKGDNDDVRESLSFKVKKGLEFHGAEVIYHDPYLPAESSPLELLDSSCDALILCTPHKEYRTAKFKVPVIDIWGIFDRTQLEVFPGKKAQ